MTRQQVDALVAGDSMIARKPGGYWCRVVAVDRWRERVKIADLHSACHVYWVSFKTLIAEWRRTPQE